MVDRKFLDDSGLTDSKSIQPAIWCLLVIMKKNNSNSLAYFII